MNREHKHNLHYTHSNLYPLLRVKHKLNTLPFTHQLINVPLFYSFKNPSQSQLFWHTVKETFSTERNINTNQENDYRLNLMSMRNIHWTDNKTLLHTHAQQKQQHNNNMLNRRKTHFQTDKIFLKELFSAALILTK